MSQNLSHEVRKLGHDMQSDHVIVPSDHAPIKETRTKGIVGMMVVEKRNESAFISSDITVPIQQ